MELRLELPPDLLPLLGPDPSRYALEALLLRLVGGGGALSLARAAEHLGLSREAAVRWYTAHRPYPEYTPEEWAEELAALRGEGR